MNKNKKMIKLSHNCLYIISTAFFLSVTALHPLYIRRTHFINITGDKAYFFLAITGIAATLTMLALFFTTTRFQVKDYFVSNEPVRRLSISEWAIVAFVLLVLLSSVFSPHGRIVWMTGPLGRWEGFWVLLCYVVAFFIIARFYKPKRWHLLAFAGSVILVSLYGVLQFMGWDTLITSGFFVNLPQEGTSEWHLLTPTMSRLFRTTLGNTNIVSAYAAMTTVLFSALFAGEESPWCLVYAAACGLSFALLLISRGDAGALGVMAAMTLAIPYWMACNKRLGKIFIILAVCVAVFIGYNIYLDNAERWISPELLDMQRWNIVDRRFNYPGWLQWAAAALFVAGVALQFLKKWPSQIMKIAGVIILAVMIIGGIAFINVAGERREDNPNDIIWQAREMLNGRFEDHFGSGRVFVWRNALPVVADRPILGSGPGTFFQAMGEEFQEMSSQQFGATFDTAHNTYLQMAITLGIPALLAYLIFLAALFIPAAKAAFSRPILLAFSVAALSYLVQSLFQVDTPIDRPLLWTALGVMAGELWRSKIEHITSPQ